jgi:DNA-binding response OmpR family regulator
VAELERLALEAEGHAVAVALDGSSGLLAARRDRPDVVVLDLALPPLEVGAVLSGLDLAPTSRGLPVVAVTGNLDQAEDSALRRVAAVIRKPFELDAFVQAIERAAQRSGASSK